jgi:ankyrin repeat protein
MSDCEVEVDDAFDSEFESEFEPEHNRFAQEEDQPDGQESDHGPDPDDIVFGVRDEAGVRALLARWKSGEETRNIRGLVLESGQNLMQFAVANNAVALVRALHDEAQFELPPLQAAAQWDSPSLELLKFLVDECRVPVDSATDDLPPVIFGVVSAHTDAHDDVHTLPAMLAFLLERGARVDGRSPDGATLLEVASESMLPVLLELKPDIVESIGDVEDAVTAMLRLPSMAPVLDRYICDHNVAIRELNEDTFLIAAALRAENAAAIAVLLKHGAVPTQDDLHTEPWFLNSHNPDIGDAVSLLLDCDASIFSPEQTDLFESAVKGGHIGLVQRLVAMGASIGPSLHCAVLSFAPNALQIVDVLLQIGDIDVDTLDSMGRTPLCAVCSNKWSPSIREECQQSDDMRVVVARRLLRAGADVRKTDSVGRTALHYACATSTSVELLQLLIASGADVDCADAAGASPFFAACMRDAARQDTAFLEALLDVGASVCPLGNGFTPAHALATRPLALDCLRLLAERGVSVTTPVAGRSPLFFAVHCLETFVWLHERGASLAESATAHIELPLFSFENPHGTCGASDAGDTPLDAAILNGAIDVVEFLLANGALVDERALIKSVRNAPLFRCMLKLPRDRSRDHALAAAAFCTDFETAVVALAHGAQPDLSDESLARRVADASCGEYTFLLLLLLDGIKAAVRFSRPTCLAAAVACGVPVGSELLAFIQTPRFKREQRFVVNEINAVAETLRGMGLRIVEPRASEICFALQSWRLPALLTMLIIDEACPLAAWVTDHHKWSLVTTIKHFR